MKKIYGLLVVLMAGSLILAGCEGGSCTKKAEGPKEEVVVEETVEEVAPAPVKVSEKAVKISEALSKALCARMVECAPGTMTEEECVAQTTISLNEAQVETPIEASDSQLEACVSAIKSGTCEAVLGTEPPAGCEFLK